MLKKSCTTVFEQKDDALLLVRIVGDIDHHSVKHIREAIDAEIFKTRPKKVTIDFTNVSFMDSSGLGLIMGRHSLCQDMGSVLTVRNPSQRTLKIMSLVALERIVTIENTNTDKTSIIEGSVKNTVDNNARDNQSKESPSLWVKFQSQNQ